MANYFYNLGLVSTSVSSSSILSNTSAIFVFLIEVTLFFKTIQFSWLKPLWVVVCFAGITMITVADNSSQKGSDSNHSFLGDMYSLIGAACYGVYAIYLKVKVPPEKEKNFKFSHFLGFVGLFNLVLLLPLFPIFDALKIEKFEWPN
jgi:solute carrier family 35 protein F5